MLYNSSEPLRTEIVEELMSLLKCELAPQQRRIIEWLINRKVVKEYLRVQDVKANERYDQKAHLVTQSELLSGGIRSDDLNFCSGETLQQIKDCARLINQTDLLPTFKVEQQEPSIYLAVSY